MCWRWGLSALFFSTVGWRVAAPLAEWGGVSVMVWANHGIVAGMLQALLLALMLGLATAVCSFLVHPDSPHMGLFCALLGIGGLSIRGGTIHMLLEQAEQTGALRETGAAAGPRMRALGAGGGGGRGVYADTA